MASLAGKHIVITGASAGIGAELARQLGAHQCKLTLAARRKELLDDVCAEVIAAGGLAHSVITDVTQREQVFALAEAARGHFSEIDIWVSNAGGGILHRVLEATEEDMLWQYRLNCLSSLWAYQAVVPGWLERGYGQIIDVNSVGGKAGFAYAGGYVAAKAAMSNLGDTLRMELAGTGITITTAYPGTTVSDFSKARPDRSGGSATSDSTRLRGSKSFLTRQVIKRQPTEHVARCIIRAMLKPVPTIYPHRWGAFAVLVNNLWPAFVLKQVARSRGSAR